MKQPIEKLKDKLSELFQFDQADLDFGIYRIMNAKRGEITRFLEQDLLPQVKQAFKEYKPSDKAEIQKELDKVIEGVKAAGMDPEQSPKVKELQARLKEDSVDLTALENEVYSRLYDFFSRYYDSGDFISLRRYKKDVYAIPYEGEEVKLHWANADQYYIKTTEYFRDYAFKAGKDKRVHFKIIEADTEKDNRKAANGNNRRFFLHRDKPVAEEEGELVIRFEYRPDSQKRKQEVLNAEIVRRFFDYLKNGELADWVHRLSAKAPTEKNPDRTVLEKHLADYTRRNTFDYFIHKDLGGFLRRELDFYIKNEVMHLDDVENESAPRVEQYLSKIRVIRKIAHKIIDFLAQLENFQKKLWLKKKFVVETNYCVTLDRVPDELYPEIIANDEQREEWVRLFVIDEIEEDLITPAYSEPLTVEFLKANPFLIVDTNYFGENFKNRLLGSFATIDDRTDGFLVHGENFQALNLIEKVFKRKQIDSIYLDPPYNTGNDEFQYKDNYQHSSWMSMMFDRLVIAKTLLSNQGCIFISCDDIELYNLKIILDKVFGIDSHLETLIWKKRATAPNDRHIGKNHEYIISFCKDPSQTVLYLQPRDERLNRTYKNPDNDPDGPWSASDLSAAGKGGRLVESCIFSIMNLDTGKEYLPPKNKCWLYNKEKIAELLRQGRIGFRRNTGAPFLKRYLSEVRQGATLPTIIIDGGFSSDSAKEIRDLFNEDVIEFPKTTRLLEKVITASMSSNGIVLDFYAGSGTTTHALMNLNRQDNGKRKYILVEMGDYFDTVLVPRIKKVVYSKDWKNGKPISQEGISHTFKYLRLESYEDTLANLELTRTDAQQTLLDASDSFRESYMLKYMLDTESSGSQSLLNIDAFEEPFNYKLLVGTGSVGETEAVNVDLVETFNWLLGLRVRHMDHIRGFRVIEGMSPDDEKVLIIWRNIKEKSNEDLEDFFRKQQYNTMDMEFNVIYVNGDNNLMNIPMASAEGELEPRYKVRLIEEEFKRLMFDVKDV
jgi:adenine-specific DNA-methyltransferase